jgi:hypothetical protein
LLRQVERNLGGKRAGRTSDDEEIEVDDDAI